MSANRTGVLEQIPPLVHHGARPVPGPAHARPASPDPVRQSSPPMKAPAAPPHVEPQPAYVENWVI
jgi:hypothetical protein